MGNFVASETKEVFSILDRIRRRDFRGNSGAAIRNSTYQMATTLTSKFFSLIFTIILARILMPELFGLYSLALFTVLIFSFFSDLGVGNTLVRFVSKELSKKNESKAKAYFIYLFKLKFLILSGVFILFLVLTKPITFYYQKPLFVILLSSSLYFFSISLSSFLQNFFHSLNDFKTPFIREALFQTLRLILVPLLVLYLLSKSFSGEIVLISIFLSFGVLWAIMSLFLFFTAKKTKVFLSKEGKISEKEKKETNLFFKSLIAFSIFSIIFTYTDLIILGRFASAEYIGFYQVAMGLIGSLSALILFSGSLFPIFSRLKGNVLEKGFEKSLKLTLFVSLGLFILSFLFAEIVINILYGKAYLQATPFFQALCFLLILWPINALYNGYFMAVGKPNIIRNLLIFAALLNLALGFSLAYILLPYGQTFVVFGVIFALVFSNIIYLIGCVWKKRKLN